MPFTTLTLREQGELQRLQKNLYGDLFERGLKGKEFSIDRGLTDEEIIIDKEKLLLEKGEEMYGKEGINALYFYHKTITANTQVGIDEYIKALIQELAKAKIKGLNKTTLTVYELN